VAGINSVSTYGSFGLIATDNGTLSGVAGTWSITYTWSGTSAGTAPFVLDPAGTYSVQGSTGTWTYVGTTLTLRYDSSPAVYTGTVTGNTVSGTMVSGTSTGTFTGVKQ
jgi:hypothetical protein